MLARRARLLQRRAFKQSWKCNSDRTRVLVPAEPGDDAQALLLGEFGRGQEGADSGSAGNLSPRAMACLTAVIESTTTILRIWGISAAPASMVAYRILSHWAHRGDQPAPGSGGGGGSCCAITVDEAPDSQHGQSAISESVRKAWNDVAQGVSRWDRTGRASSAKSGGARRHVPLTIAAENPLPRLIRQHCSQRRQFLKTIHRLVSGPGDTAQQQDPEQRVVERP